jgi:putative PIN family toxin of toxin-antitoxin system
MIKAGYDTNVIVSAALYEESLPALLLSLALEDEVRLFVSPALLHEYETVLKRPRFKLDENEIMELMKKINRIAVMVTPTKRLSILKTDEADNQILECALKARVNFIVTGNKRHFSFEEFKGVRIVTPRGFIDQISEL